MNTVNQNNENGTVSERYIFYSVKGFFYRNSQKMVNFFHFQNIDVVIYY